MLWGRGVEEQGAPPLWLWRRILGAVGGDNAWGQLTRGVAAEGARSDDLTAVRYRAGADAVDAITTAADQAGLLLVLEDLHWADEASLFLLHELAAELPESRLLVLATSREATDDPRRVALGDLARLPGVHMLRLGGLDEAALAGILRAAGVTVTPELARLVRAHGGGNRYTSPPWPGCWPASRVARSTSTRSPGSWAAAPRSAGWSGPCCGAWTTMRPQFWRRPVCSARPSTRPWWSHQPGDREGAPRPGRRGPARPG